MSGLEPTKITGSDPRATQVPAGLDSRGFQLHRIFCRSGDFRCPACKPKADAAKAKKAAEEESRAASAATLKALEDAVKQAQAEAKRLMDEAAGGGGGGGGAVVVEDADASETESGRMELETSVSPPLGASVGPGPDGNGIAIFGVVEGSNAEQAGLEKGDFVVSINGEPITACSHEDALGVFASQPTGARRLRLSREKHPPSGGGGAKGGGAAAAGKDASADGEPKDFIDALAAAETEAEAEAATVGTGDIAAASGRDVTVVRAPGQGLGIQLAATTADGRGFTVHTVVAGSASVSCGVVPGDVILAIDGHVVSQLMYDDALTVLRGAAATGDAIVLSMLEGGPELAVGTTSAPGAGAGAATATATATAARPAARGNGGPGGASKGARVSLAVRNKKGTAFSRHMANTETDAVAPENAGDPRDYKSRIPDAREFDKEGGVDLTLPAGSPLGVNFTAASPDGIGLVVVGTQPGKAAARTGMRPGDRVIAIAGVSVEGVATAEAAALLAAHSGEITIRVTRAITYNF